MKNTFLLKNAKYLGKTIDIQVEKGIIINIDENLSENCPHIDAKNQVLFPSFTDCHTHMRDPGQEWKEDIESGLNAALHGGFVNILCMANTKPVNDNASITKAMKGKAQKLYPHGPYLYPMAAATIGLKGKEITPLEEMKNAGAIAVSNDGVPITDTALMRRIMEYASDLNLLVVDHCEEPFLAAHTHANEGIIATELGLKAQPDIAEAMQVTRDAMLAEYLNIPVHIAHISAKITLDYLGFAKSRGVQITGETCPQYLLLDETEILNYNTLAKINPPLRRTKDTNALKEAIKSGLIDIMVTDHAPHAAYEKEQPFDLAPNGMTGLDTAMSLTWLLHTEDIITQEDIIRLWVTKPAQIFNLPFHNIAKGSPAHFFLFDPNIKWKVSPETLYSKSANTPFLGKTLTGRVTQHFIHGIPMLS